uniref:Uncharacterized protein n=1 Tax=Haematococcus lacustris TaxID=44745 RepID=A0A2K9YRJ0_HAELA|nr:hypothetical protein SG3EUKT974126.1 [Haematococcus lacustris]YP_009463669.1 hypothetical protein SG3EUKT975778.1 [Haematococcus lacustris]AUW36424.1 hypothetical protein SG3EUKT974126.1 [Haematococcus lacustris]AUW36491.1 hypothetical protein SG3EUKT975778.1 [Haematococcus lacustris]
MGGESGPKARPKGVVDGKQVKIPVLFLLGTKGRSRLNWDCDWNTLEALKQTILEKKLK